MIDTITWDCDDANLEIYCDATPGSIGFYCPSHDAGFFAALPENTPVDTIFYYEALCVVSALVGATELPSALHRILIHTDSLNTGDVPFTKGIKGVLRPPFVHNPSHDELTYIPMCLPHRWHQ